MNRRSAQVTQPLARHQGTWWTLKQERPPVADKSDY